MEGGSPICLRRALFLLASLSEHAQHATALIVGWCRSQLLLPEPSAPVNHEPRERDAPAER